MEGIVKYAIPDKGEVDAESPVLSGALQADPNPVGDGHPLRIVGPALETFLDQKFNV
jgi:hypothetical protein